MGHIWVDDNNSIDIEAKYYGMSSRLEVALLDNQIKKTLQLIRLGSDINYKDSKNRTPLMAAVESNNPKMCKFLIEHNANLEIKDVYGKTAYLRAAKLSNNPRVLEVLEENNCNIYVRDENNDTALFLAALYNDSEEIIKHLIKKGFSPDDNDDVYHYTPIMAAAHYNKNPKVVSSILEASTEVDLEDKDGCTALMHSAYHEWDNPEIFWTIYSFLKKKEPRKIRERLLKRDKGGKNMLDIAHEEGKTEVAQAIEKAMDELVKCKQ